MKKIYCLIIICTLIIGCKAKDDYYYLSAEAKKYMPYKEGEIFYLKDSFNDDIIPFKVTSVKNEMKQGHNSGSGHIYFGPSGDDYYEYCEIELTSTVNCFNIILKFEALETQNEDSEEYINFGFNASLKTCSYNAGLHYPKKSDIIDNVNYFKNTIAISGYDAGVYSRLVISEKGIVYLRVGEHYYHIEDYIVQNNG